MVLLLLMFTLPLSAPTALDDDKAAIREVIASAYVRGVHVERSAELMRRGFHPDFVMFVRSAEGPQKVTLNEWIARIEKGQKPATKPDIRHEFTSILINGHSAVAQVEIHRDGKHQFTDYLSLYKLPEGWRIIAKIFEAH